VSLLVHIRILLSLQVFESPFPYLFADLQQQKNREKPAGFSFYREVARIGRAVVRSDTPRHASRLEIPLYLCRVFQKMMNAMQEAGIYPNRKSAKQEGKISEG
jgi:hypothetical protein